MDLISIIVPVYNVEQYLMRCVDSVRKQTYQNLEIILVDDGSPDRCPEICEEIKTIDSRVKVIHKKNGGLGFARNSGLEEATGQYVTFIDSDDWISEDHIENLYREAKRTDADAVIGGHTTVASDGTMYRHTKKLEQKCYEGTATREQIVLPLIGADVNDPQDVMLESSSCMNLYRCDVLKRKNIWFRSEKDAVAEDMYFNIDFFCNAEKLAVLAETGYFYFENVGSISRKYDPKRFERTIRFYEILKEQALQYNLQEEVSFRIERSFLMKVRVAIRLIVFSDLSYKEKIQQIGLILENQIVKTVLDSYPVHSYATAMWVLTEAMRRRNVRFVYWLIWIRENARKSASLKRILKQIGVGK